MFPHVILVTLLLLLLLLLMVVVVLVVVGVVLLLLLLLLCDRPTASATPLCSASVHELSPLSTVVSFLRLQAAMSRASR